mgnify:CR=1 FL=1
MSGERTEPSHPAPPTPENRRDWPPPSPISSPHSQPVPRFPRPVAREGSLGRRTEAAAGAERTGSVSDRRPPIARAGQGEPQRKAATVRAGGSGCPAGGGTRRTPPTSFRGLKPRASATGRRHRDAEPTGPSDGAFDPSAREAPARVEGVTRTVPGPRRRAACPSWAPGVAANNGACPELMSNSSRGASAFVETVNHIFSGRSPGAPPSPLAARSRRGG